MARAEEQTIRQQVEQRILAGAVTPTGSLPDNGRQRETELRAGVAGARQQVTVGQPHVEPGGTQPRQQVEVQREATVGLNPSLPFRKLEGGANTGVTANAQFNMTSADVEAIRRGDRPMPDLNDPRTLPVGSSATLRAETQQSTAGGAGFRGVGVYQQNTQSQGQQVQVERLSEERVRVSSGPTRGERTETEGRHMLAPLGAVTGEQNLRLSQTTGSREFDISTPEGRTAYQQHVAQSLQPNGTTTGPVSEATLEANNRVAGGFRLSVPFARLGNNGELASQEVSATYRATEEGGVQRDVRARMDDVAMNSTRTFRPDGTEDPSAARTTVTLNNLNANDARNLRFAFGQTDRVPIGRTNSAELQITPQSLGDLQGRIRDRFGGDAGVANMGASRERAFYQAMLGAQSPEDAARVMMQTRHAGYLNYALMPLRMGDREFRPLPGSVAVTMQQ